MGADQDLIGQAESMVPEVWSLGEGPGLEAQRGVVSVELVFKATDQGGVAGWEGAPGQRL